VEVTWRGLKREETIGVAEQPVVGKHAPEAPMIKDFEGDGIGDQLDALPAGVPLSFKGYVPLGDKVGSNEEEEVDDLMPPRWQRAGVPLIALGSVLLLVVLGIWVREMLSSPAETSPPPPLVEIAISPTPDNDAPEVKQGASVSVSMDVKTNDPASAAPIAVATENTDSPLMMISDGKGGFRQVLETSNGTKSTTPIDIIGKQAELEKSVDKLKSDFIALKDDHKKLKAGIAEAAKATPMVTAAASSASPAPMAKAPKAVKTKGTKASAPSAPAPFKPVKYGQYVAKVKGGAETLTPAQAPLFQGVSERRTAPDGTEYFVQSDVPVVPISKLGK